MSSSKNLQINWAYCEEIISWRHFMFFIVLKMLLDDGIISHISVKLCSWKFRILRNFNMLQFMIVNRKLCSSKKLLQVCSHKFKLTHLRFLKRRKIKLAMVLKPGMQVLLGSEMAWEFLSLHLQSVTFIMLNSIVWSFELFRIWELHLSF